MKKRSYFKLPNTLIHDTALPYSTRRVGAALYAYSNALGTCRKSYAQIARLAGCSESTAVAAVRQLAAAGYISFCRTSRYCHAIRGVGKGKNLYSVSLNVLEDGYTFVSRDVFYHAMTDAAFVVYMEMLLEIGNRDHGWPSISRMQEKTGAARSTVLAGLKLLKTLPTLLVRLCVRRNGAFAANSYISCHDKSQGIVQANTFTPLLFYLKAARAICQGARRLFSHFFSRGVGRNLVIYSYYLDNDRSNSRKERISLLRRVYAKREDKRKIKNKKFFLNPRAGAASALSALTANPGAAEPP